MQIVCSSSRRARDIEHIGSAHGESEAELLRAPARQRIAAGQGELDPGLDDRQAAGGSLEITSSRAGTCGPRCAGRMRCAGLTGRQRATWHSGSWCWCGSSSRPACGIWGNRDRQSPRPHHPRTPPGDLRDSLKQIHRRKAAHFDQSRVSSAAVPNAEACTVIFARRGHAQTPGETVTLPVRECHGPPASLAVASAASSSGCWR